MTKLNVLAESNAFFGTSIPTQKALLAKCLANQSPLLDRWLKSGRTDYSVYEAPEYINDTLFCYAAISSLALSEMMKFFGNLEVGHFKCLDVYNGCGLSTVQANLLGFKTDGFNTNPQQIEFCQSVAERNSVKVKNHTDLSKLKDASYDVVFSFEVIEHFKNPLEHVRDIARLVKPGGYLVESYGFRTTDLVGHFAEYDCDGEIVEHLKTPTRVRNQIKSLGFTKVFRGFNSKPRIWVRDTNVVVPKDAMLFKPKSFVGDHGYFQA